MKNFLFVVFALCLFSVNAVAQTSSALWVGSNTQDRQALEVHTAMADAFNAWAAGDVDKGSAVYAVDAIEIGMDGSIVHGRQAMIDGWNAFMSMVDEAPKFTFENVQVRFLTADVVLATFDSAADIKMGGQQVGGQVSWLAVLQKISGKWQIVADAGVAVMPQQ